MATAHLGTLNSFNITDEPITSYLEHVQLLFAATSVGDGKQVPTFPSIVGPASPRELPLWSATTFTKEINSKERLQLNTMQLFANSQHTVNSLTTSRKPFAIGLSAAYGTELFNDDCSQRRNSHSQKLWTLPFQWRHAAEKNTRSVKGHDSSIKKIKEQYRPRSH